ncbi:hypothetical protein MML48_9g00005397 [Holotrichia oblita]|uniref:Uncharacterized protein n=1 Tax=Holotrichia oblita TaxID=644536 RepID=A0ACB9SLN8_HOLOL|nr:hypothetical protein MML48_9g00005397 [Holotrichia oblita]
MQCLIDAGCSILPKEAQGMAKAFLFFDKLFDSLNGVGKVAQEGHDLRCAITANTQHHKFWEEAKIILNTMKFQCRTTGKLSTPPSLKNWI